MRRYRNRIIIGVVLGFGVIAATALLSDVSALLEQAVAFPWLIMVPVLGLRVANWALRFLKWHFYLHVVGVRDIRPVDSGAVFLTGFVFSLSPGKIAEVLKAVMIRYLTGVPIATSLPVVFAERLSDGLAVILLLAVSIGALAAGEYWSVVLISLSVFAVLIALLQRRALCLWLLGRGKRLPVLNRIAGALYAFYESSYEMARWPNVLVAVGLGTVANLLDGLGVYLILVGVGQPALSETFFQALLVISLSVVVGSLSALPGGLGAADLSIGVTMHAGVGMGAAETGLATLLARFVQLWWGVLVGMGIGFAWRHRLLPPNLDEIDGAEEPADYLADGATAR